MIQAKELRIGNLINERDRLIKVNWQEIKWVQEDLNNIFQQIPLTEDWLLKFGFKETMKWTFAIDLVGNLKLVYYCGEKGFSIGFKNHSDFNNLIYVHQLQNLYFALTQKELEI